MNETGPGGFRRSERPRHVITFRRYDIQPSQLQTEALQRYREQVRRGWLASQERAPFDGEEARRALERHRRRVIWEWLQAHPDTAA